MCKQSDTGLHDLHWHCKSIFLPSLCLCYCTETISTVSKIWELCAAAEVGLFICFDLSTTRSNEGLIM